MNERYVILLYLLMSFILTECRRSNDFEEKKSNLKITYRPEFNHLDVQNIGKNDHVPDSIFLKCYRSIYFYNSELDTNDDFFKRIKPDNLVTLRFIGDSLHCNFYDLTKFKNLQSLNIDRRRNSKCNKIELKFSPACKLKSLILSGGEFPEFDSSFLSLEDLYYSGNADTMPKWIEDLDSLRRILFDSRNLKEINVDICQLQSIRCFDISFSDYFKGERFDKVKNKCAICKPFLSFDCHTPPAK